MAHGERHIANEGRCWALAVARVRALTGIVLPADYAAALAAPEAIAEDVAPGAALRRGDLIQCRGIGGGRDHVAVAVDAFEAEHLAADGAAMARVSIAALRRAGAVVRVMRPRAGVETRGATESHGGRR